MGVRSSLKRRLRATVLLASLLGASAGFVAAVSLAERNPATLERCNRGAPVKSAVCIVNDALSRVRR